MADVATVLRMTISKVAGQEDTTEGVERIPIAFIYYLMRATQVSTGLYVYWESINAPDITGAFSGIPIADLTLIRIVGTRPRT